MRRGDHAHVDLPLVLATDPADAATLEGTQEAWLELEGHLADLVQKQCPAVGALERPHVTGNGAGEGAALVPEQLALRQVGGHGATVEHDERARRPRARRVQGMRQHILARAGLAEERHRHIRLREALQSVEHVVHGLRPGAHAPELPRGGSVARRRPFRPRGRFVRPDLEPGVFARVSVVGVGPSHLHREIVRRRDPRFALAQTPRGSTDTLHVESLRVIECCRDHSFVALSVPDRCGPRC